MTHIDDYLEGCDVLGAETIPPATSMADFFPKWTKGLEDAAAGTPNVETMIERKVGDPPLPKHPVAPAPSVAMVPVLDAPPMSASKAKGLGVVTTILASSLIGGAVGGGVGALLWPAHRLLGLFLGFFFLGTPIGGGVGAYVALKGASK